MISAFPNLRFPGFEGEWEFKKLGDIGDVKMCRRIFNHETSAIGEIPFFKIGSFGKEADAFISKKLYLDYKNRFSFPKKGDVLISAAGTIGRTVVYNGEDAYYQDSNIIWIDNDNSKVTNKFLYHVLQIVKYNTEGGTIQRLYNNILKSTKFSSPQICEQNKISSFLSLLDERIQTQKKIIGDFRLLKKEITKRIFNQKIKFKTSNQEGFPIWKLTKLENILIKYEEKSAYSNQYPILTSARTGIYFQKDYFDDNEVASKDNTGYNIVPRGYFTYRHMSDDIVFKFNINNLCDKGIVSTLYPVFTTKGVNDYFLKEYLNEGQEFKNYALLQKQGGSRTYMYFKKLNKLALYFPCIEEQTKIAEFLSKFDAKINLENKLLTQYENQKKYLLRNLFV